MSFLEAIQTICNLNEEIKAVEILMSRIKDNTEVLEKENAEMASCLTAIKKINRKKSEAIDALCERG